MSEEYVGPDDGEGGVQQSWHEQFLAGDEFAELRENETIKGTPDIPTLAKRLVDTKALVGRKGVILPKEDAAPEEWEQFYTALGRPETAEAYDLKPEGLPEDFPYLPELETSFRQLAHQAGLAPGQAKKIYDGYNKFMLELHQHGARELQARVVEMQTALRKEWGGKYDDNLGVARKAMQMVAPPGSQELLALDQVLGDSPVLVKFFYNLGQSMSEGQFVAGGGGQSSGLAARRQELMSSEAYANLKHADHQKVVDEVWKITNEMYPENKEA